MKCALEGCDKPARKRFCSNKCKDKYYILIDKERGTGRYKPKLKVKKMSVIETFRW